MPRLSTWFKNARLRRRWLIPLLAAAGGGLAVLLVQWQWTGHWKFLSSSASVTTPASLQQGPKVGIPQDSDLLIPYNPCQDLHGYVCALKNAKDPTGDVRRDSEGEVQVLRIYERIIRSNPGMEPEQVDDLLVKEVYTPRRTNRIKVLFEKARASLVHFINSQPDTVISAAEKQQILERLAAVKLELPPPASIYSDEPDLFTRNDVYFEETRDGAVRIRVGGALFFTIRSHFNLAFTMAHELAHSIDPCELRAHGIDVRAYQTVAQCFGTPPEAMELECSSRGKLPEVFADWAATEVAADLLTEMAPKFTPIQLRSAVFSTMRDLCREEDDDPDEIEAGLASSHPTGTYRMNRIFGEHPRIRAFLGCHDSRKALAVAPPYCTWTGPGGLTSGTAAGATGAFSGSATGMPLKVKQVLPESKSQKQGRE